MARKDVVLTDPRAIRALAHPARLSAVERLYAEPGQSRTATQLAAEAGLTPSAMSYHLRALEKWGVLERAEDLGDARERPWRAAGRSLQVRSGHAARAASGALVGRLVERLATQLEEYSERREREPEEWRGAGGFSRDYAYLTPEEAREVEKELEALLRKHSRRRTRTRGTRRVDLTWALVPEPPDEPDS